MYHQAQISAMSGIIISGNKKNGAKRFKSVQKASCLKQNQKWEYVKFIVTFKTATDQ